MTDICHCHSPITTGIDRLIAEVDYFKGERGRKGTKDGIKGGKIKNMGENVEEENLFNLS
jgi:hypothetical protein